MKTKLILIAALIVALHSNRLVAQEVIMSLDTFTTYAADEDSSIPDDVTYIKDVNNLLTPFVGTFSGTHGNKVITFEITSYTHQGRILRDRLNIKYKIEDVNGTIIVQTMNIPNNSHDIKGLCFTVDGSYMAVYVGFDGCAQAGTFYLNLYDTTMQPTTTPNQLHLYLDQARELLTTDECPNGTTHVFPVNVQFILNRI